MRSSIRTGIVVATFPLSATALAGQAITRLSPCTTCELRVTHMASLGSAAEPDSPADERHRDVVHDARGRYFVRAGWPVNRILVYDTGGNLETVWGRGGEGPGEYRSIMQLLMLRGDSLGAFDRVNARLTVLNADGTVARTQVLRINPYPHQVAQLADGSIVVAGGEHTAAATGYLMHVVRPGGSVSPSVPDETVDQFRPSAAQRRLAAEGMTVWAARPDRYEITEYAAEGTPLRMLKRVVDWFPDREVEGPVDFAKDPPAPYLTDVHVDDEGFIWTMVRLADADWAPVDEVGSLSGERRYDSIVEVMDPDRGVVLRSQRFPWNGQGFTNDGLIVSRRVDALGVVIVDVWGPAW